VRSLTFLHAVLVFIFFITYLLRPSRPCFRRSCAKTDIDIIIYYYHSSLISYYLCVCVYKYINFFRCCRLAYDVMESPRTPTGAISLYWRFREILLGSACYYIQDDVIAFRSNIIFVEHETSGNKQTALLLHDENAYRFIEALLIGLNVVKENANG